jgi:hypothetical protein
VAVLGLAYEIDRDHPRDRQESSAMTCDFRRAAKTSMPTLAKQHPLRFGDELVAGSDDDVRGTSGEESLEPSRQWPARRRAS